MRIWKIAALLVMASTTIGCASITSGEHQTIQFATRDAAGNAVDKASCEWKNSRASGVVVAPGTASVKRDYDALHVACQKEGFGVGTASVNSKAQAAMAGNILVGGLIGAAIDHTSGNAYEYPPIITVRLGSSIRIESQKITPGQRQTAQGHKDGSLIPPASGYASITDVGAIPSKSQGCRDIFSRYMGLVTPKAMAFSSSGRCSSRTGPNAIDDALQSCSEEGKHRCSLYAVDNEVVWNPGAGMTRTASVSLPAPAPAPQHAGTIPAKTDFAHLDAVDAVPRLGAKGKELYSEWLDKPFPRAVAISEKGSIARAYGETAMTKAVENCEKFNNPCRLYAVDDRVVFVPFSAKLL